MGGYKLAFPSLNPEKQELYDTYLKASVCTVPFPISQTIPKKNSTMQKLKKSIHSEKQEKLKNGRNKGTKSPYLNWIRKMVTPIGQKRKNYSNKSKQL